MKDTRPVIKGNHEYGYSKGENMKIKPSDLGLPMNINGKKMSDKEMKNRMVNGKMMSEKEMMKMTNGKKKGKK